MPAIGARWESELVRQIRFKLRKLLLHTLLHADDSAHQLAMGASIGTLLSFLPIFGIQMVTAFAVATVVRANKAITIPFVWITNPVTVLPVYGACLLLGRWIMRTSGSSSPMTAKALLDKMQPSSFGELFTAAYWSGFWDASVSIGLELWLGCSIVGVIGGVIAYFVVRRIVVAFRHHHRHRIARYRTREERRATRELLLNPKKPAPDDSSSAESKVKQHGIA